jgi:hypothetical protein
VKSTGKGAKKRRSGILIEDEEAEDEEDEEDVQTTHTRAEISRSRVIYSAMTDKTENRKKE